MMNETVKNKRNSKYNAGVGAAMGVLLGSAFADLIVPGSSLVGLLCLFAGAAIGARIGYKHTS